MQSDLGVIHLNLVQPQPPPSPGRPCERAKMQVMKLRVNVPRLFKPISFIRKYTLTTYLLSSKS